MINKSVLLLLVFLVTFWGKSVQAFSKYDVNPDDTLKIVFALDQLIKFYNENKMDSSLYYAEKAILTSKELFDSKEIQSNDVLFKRVKSLTLESYLNYSSVLAETNMPAARDTLEMFLKLLKDDDFLEKGYVYSEMGTLYRQSLRTEKGVEYSKKALEMFRVSESEIDYMYELNSLGLVLRENGNYGESLDYLLKALKTARNLNDNSATIEALLAIGFVYALVEKKYVAIKYQQEALELFEQANDSIGIARVHNDMGVTFDFAGEIDSALVHHKKALALRLNYNNEYDTFSSYTYIGDLLALNGDIKGAIENTEKGLSYTNHPYITSIISSYIKLGDFYNKLPDSNKANDTFIKAKQLSEENEYSEGILSVAIQLARLAEKNGNYKQALSFLRLAEGKAPEVNLQVKSLFYKAIAFAYSELGDYKKAYQNNVIYAGLKDSVLAAENLSKVTKMTNIMAFENELALKKENNERIMALKQAEIDREKVTRNLFLVGMIVAVIFVVITLVRFFEKKKLNETLEHTLSNLKSTQKQLIQSEKMASLGELTAGIAHEIQNPLNFVNNFSELSSELIDEMNQEVENGDFEEVKFISADIKSNLEKITHHGKRAEGIVKGMLQHSRSSSGIKEKTDLNALCDEYLRLAYQGLRVKDKSFNATLTTDFDAKLGKIDILPQEMGRVILNLITNAFYAVKERKTKDGDAFEPQVSISTKIQENEIHILVSDNGYGIPDSIKDKIFQPFFTTKPTGQGTGLGLSMSYDIIKNSHQGELLVETIVNQGTIFTIKLPINI